MYFITVQHLEVFVFDWFLAILQDYVFMLTEYLIGYATAGVD